MGFFDLFKSKPKTVLEQLAIDCVKKVETSSESVAKSAIDELNGYGIPQKLDLECECCGHKWEEKFYGYNMSDFFGISS